MGSGDETSTSDDSSFTQEFKRVHESLKLKKKEMESRSEMASPSSPSNLYASSALKHEASSISPGKPNGESSSALSASLPSQEPEENSTSALLTKTTYGMQCNKKDGTVSEKNFTPNGKIVIAANVATQVATQGSHGSRDCSDDSSSTSSSTSSSSSDSSSVSSKSFVSQDHRLQQNPGSDRDGTSSSTPRNEPVSQEVPLATKTSQRSSPSKSREARDTSLPTPDTSSQIYTNLNAKQCTNFERDSGRKHVQTQRNSEQDEDDFFPFFREAGGPPPSGSSLQDDRMTSSSRYFQGESRQDTLKEDGGVACGSDTEAANTKVTSSDKPGLSRQDPTISMLDAGLMSTGRTDHRSHKKRVAVEMLEAGISNVDQTMETSFPSREEQLAIEVLAEVDPKLYTPPTYQKRRPTVLHTFSFQNRPSQARKRIPIAQLFSSPVNLLWKSSKFDHFNAFQSEIANQICYSDDNIVVSAPTGAGKTALFEMAIARLVYADLCGSRYSGNNNVLSFTKHRKIVYISPSKALCEERFADWQVRLAEMGLGFEIAMITGEVEGGEGFHDFIKAHLILTTPEKFDGITRRWTENFFLFASVKLILLDEVHLLGDSSRGCCLESIVTRLKTIQRAARRIQVSLRDIRTSSYEDTTPQAISSCLRIVAVSATLPNIEDVAEFLDANEAYSFDESYRPVPLATKVIGCGNSGKNQFMFWNSIDKHVSEQIRRYSDGKQTLVFCHTKKDTERLSHMLGSINNTGHQLPSTLQDMIASGVAYHHAGLDQADRKSIEEAFAAGKLRCLCATSSLAVGVNLPARLVIVKGTKAYRGGGIGYQEVNTAQVLQMIGRAGRPGLDTRGTAVILTDNQSKQRFERLLQGYGPAESHLTSRLVEILNSEISQCVVSSVDDAVKWLKTTFLYVRLKKDPARYGLQDATQVSIDFHLVNMIKTTLDQLKDIGALPDSPENQFFPLPTSHIMSQRMTSFDTMNAIAKLPFDATRSQVLRCLSEVEAIQYPLRRHEKKILNACHQDINFKLSIPSHKVKIQTMSEKAFILLQASIGQIVLADSTLRQEMSSMTDQCSAILTAAYEFSIRGSKNGYVALQCIGLKRSLYASLWGEASGVLNQLPGIGHQRTKILIMNGITSFSDVFSSTDEAIGKASGQGTIFGKEVRAKVAQLLADKLQLSATLEYHKGGSVPAGVACEVVQSRNRSSVASTQSSGSSGLKYMLLAFTDEPGSCLFFQEEITSAGSYRFSCPQRFGKIFIHLIASLIGLDDTIELTGNQELNPSSFTGAALGSSQRQSNKPSKKLKAPKQAQSDVREALKPRADAVANARLARVSGASGLSAPVKTPRTSGVSCCRSDSKTSQVRDHAMQVPAEASNVQRKHAPSSRATVTPSPKPMNNPKHAEGLFNKSVQKHSEITVEQELAIPAARKTVRDHGSNRTVPHVEVTVTSSRESSLDQRTNQEYQRSGFQTPGSQNTRKRANANRCWNETRRKQQRKQQRAFDRKSHNPFTSYDHDPNHAEDYLDELVSGSNGRSSSLIPDSELEALRRKSAHTPTPRLASASRFNHAGKGSQRRQRTLSSHQRLSDRELLRLKREEQKTYSAFGTPRSTPSYRDSFSERGSGANSDFSMRQRRVEVAARYDPVGDTQLYHNGTYPQTRDDGVYNSPPYGMTWGYEFQSPDQHPTPGLEQVAPSHHHSTLNMSQNDCGDNFSVSASRDGFNFWAGPSELEIEDLAPTYVDDAPDPLAQQVELIPASSEPCPSIHAHIPGQVAIGRVTDGGDFDTETSFADAFL